MPVDLSKTLLSRFTVVEPSKVSAGKNTDPLYMSRRNLIDNIQTQMEAVRADEEGIPYKPTKSDGTPQQRFSRWFYKSGGKWECLPVYSYQPLLGGAVQVDTLDQVHEFLNELLKEVQNRTFDTRIQELKRPGPRGKKTAAVPDFQAEGEVPKPARGGRRKAS